MIFARPARGNASPRWKRNRRLKCECGGYHFPHRRGGGACEHSPTCGIHRALRTGDDEAIFEARYEYASKHAGVTGVCPF